MAEDCSDLDTKTTTTVVKTHRRPWAEKSQAIVPIISPLIAVLSFFSGTIFSAYQAKKSALSTEDSEWRQSLQKTTFNDADLIPSAFTLESFYKSPVGSYREQARYLQFNMLDRATQPEVFDLIFQNLLRNAGEKEVNSPAEVQDTMGDLMNLGETLNEHILTMYKTALPDKTARAQTSLSQFLGNPAPFFSTTPDDQARLKRLLIVMWELDTFSDGMDCVWNTNHTDCPHLKKDLPSGVSGVFLLNHPFGSSADGPRFTSYQSCSVQHAMEGTFYCDLNDGPQ